MPRDFTPVDQLEAIIRRWPKDPVDITGVVLDYLGRTDARIDSVLRMNNEVYDEIFRSGNEERAKAFLRAAIRSESEASEIQEACTGIFPVLADLIPAIERQTRTDSPAVEPSFFEDPTRYLGHSVEFVFWQISDVHFGKYNQLDNNPRELAALLAKAAVENPTVAPKVILASGDVSSVAATEEFASFVEFCRHLETFVSQFGSVPILAIPGNHDVRWHADGSADRMEHFRKGVADAAACVTPFGPKDETLYGGRIAVKRYNPSEATVPPFAVVGVTDRIDFILLVSGYFSGNVPEDVRKLLDADPTKERLKELLRADEGAVNREYLLNLAAALPPGPPARIGVIHHNPIPYGTETCANPFAPQLLETLFKRGVRVVLHGHTHLLEDHANPRPVSPGRAYPIPCPTLTSISASGGRGFNVFMLGFDGADVRLSVLVWSLSTSSDFKPETLTLRYSMRLTSTEIDVAHGRPLRRRKP